MQTSAAEYHRRAEDCLRALIFGVHPKTQEELAEPGVLADPDVLRALMLALRALEAKRLPAVASPDQEGRRGKPWNLEEDRTLSESFHSRRPVGEICRQLARSPEGILARLVRLELAASRDEARERLRTRRT